MPKQLLARLVAIGSFCYLLSILFVTVGAGRIWLADLLTFAWPYAIFSGLVILAIALVSRGVLAFALVLSGLGLAVYPYWAATPPPTAAACHLRVITANLFVQNEMPPQAFLDFLRAESPDILVLQETTFPWQDAISQTAMFAHESSSDLMRHDRMKVFSKLPITDEQFIIDPSVGPGVHKRPMRLELSGWNRPLVLYAIHPETPRSSGNWVERNLYLSTVTAHALKDMVQSDIIVAGDWNTPITSPFFQDVMRKANLINAGDGLLWQTTRFSLKLDPLFRVGSTIDHVALSHGLGVHERRLGPMYGSNHLPVVVDIGPLGVGEPPGTSRCGKSSS